MFQKWLKIIAFQAFEKSSKVGQKETVFLFVFLRCKYKNLVLMWICSCLQYLWGGGGGMDVLYIIYNIIRSPQKVFNHQQQILLNNKHQPLLMYTFAPKFSQNSNDDILLWSLYGFLNTLFVICASRKISKRWKVLILAFKVPPSREFPYRETFP